MSSGPKTARQATADQAMILSIGCRLPGESGTKNVYPLDARKAISSGRAITSSSPRLLASDRAPVIRDRSW